LGEFRFSPLHRVARRTRESNRIRPHTSFRATHNDPQAALKSNGNNTRKPTRAKRERCGNLPFASCSHLQLAGSQSSSSRLLNVFVDRKTFLLFPKEGRTKLRYAAIIYSSSVKQPLDIYSSRIIVQHVVSQVLASFVVGAGQRLRQRLELEFSRTGPRTGRPYRDVRPDDTSRTLICLCFCVALALCCDALDKARTRPLLTCPFFSFRNAFRCATLLSSSTAAAAAAI